MLFQLSGDGKHGPACSRVLNVVSPSSTLPLHLLSVSSPFTSQQALLFNLKNESRWFEFFLSFLTLFTVLGLVLACIQLG